MGAWYDEVHTTTEVHTLLECFQGELGQFSLNACKTLNGDCRENGLTGLTDFA